MSRWRTSHIAIAALGGVLVAILLIAVFTFASAGGAFRDEDGGHQNQGALVVRVRDDLRNFSKVRVEGAWTITIRQGDEFSVQLEVPESASQMAYVRNETLVFKSLNWKSLNSNGQGLDAYVTMPKLTKISLNGAGDLSFTGFDESHIEVNVDGAGGVTGMESSADSVKIELDGVGEVDFGDVLTKDATVNLDGLGGVTLRMDGGILDGRINGLGGISYYGQVQREQVKINGLGEVKRHF
ncbi:MAG: DUF2807 domain-containing protein [Spirochaetales bacterium]|nr:DUF2807 domain-containing protein [Spirochaetales bacterium]